MSPSSEPPASTPESPAGSTRSTPWSRITRSVFGVALFGGSLLWLSFPPVGISPLGWVALAPWISLILRPQLSGRSPYFQIWMASFMYWLATLYFIPIPHPALWLGWGVMSAILAFYPVAWIAASRQATHVFRVPPWLAVPLLWTGLEWIRAQGAISFGMVFLSHSQFRWPVILQVADLGGAYLLSFLMVGFATGIALAWRVATQFRDRSIDGPGRDPGSPWGLPWFRHMAAPLVMSGVALAAPWLYGLAALNNDLGEGTSADRAGLSIQALVIQGAIDTIFPEADEVQRHLLQQRDDYRRLTLLARSQYPDAELVIWPETIFLQPLVVRDSAPVGDASPPQSFRIENEPDVRNYWAYCMGVMPDDDGPIRPLPPVDLLTGIPVIDEASSRQYNSALLIGRHRIGARYDKCHRVMFGEYIPFGSWFPILDRWTPIGQGLAAGDGPVPIRLVPQNDSRDRSTEGSAATISMLPSVCFESTVPHLIRRHLRQAEQRGDSIDWLLNLTNDGWFFGTSCLDLHLACNVFRAIEMRRPMVVAANTGFSAEISAWGELRQVGPRRAEGILAVNLKSSPNVPSIYRQYGDAVWVAGGLFAILCLAAAGYRRVRGG